MTKPDFSSCLRYMQNCGCMATARKRDPVEDNIVTKETSDKAALWYKHWVDDEH
ncbi:predicted protein [Sclerotinia sclerotiorum 1980 UF-70]|uniref:Uncharacterized protein n=1 Tax=Sclerotinia sclerotiorum (strain ATCC 18683 / 1980 / Ss-1) TaxID=665079 RepID=A7ESA7_SCLS1|nr:predicted protein [Sclerotinia sclerotiorum 1980 UF-70]EDN92349.1 predicted protein [Sclerotinia sclerotiorum 1980 UF-70]